MYAVLVAALGWFSRYLLLRYAIGFGVFAVSAAASTAFITSIQQAITNQAGQGGQFFAQAASVTGLMDAVAIVIAAHFTAASIKGIKAAAAQNIGGPASGGSGGAP